MPWRVVWRAGVAPGLAVCIVWRCVLGGLYRGSYVSTAISELSSYCGVLFITSLMCVVELLYCALCGMARRLCVVVRREYGSGGVVKSSGVVGGKNFRAVDI